jgi:S-DNA-T family DNA segregation ATPase FtsK/SpoIIIE
MPSIDTLFYGVLALAFIVGVIWICRGKKPTLILQEEIIPDHNVIDVIIDDIPFTVETAEPILQEPVETDGDIPLTLQELGPKDEVEADISDAPQETLTADELVMQFGTYDPKLDLHAYQFPDLNLLENPGNENSELDAAELEENKRALVDSLTGFGVGIEHIKATLGPNVMLYELLLSPGTRISRVQKLESDLAVSLCTSELRVLGHIPGTGNIGIEVARRRRQVLPLRSLLSTEAFRDTEMDLPILLGRSKRNDLVMVDLAALPHLLIAGATGQGKSVCINAILISLLYKKHPAELKFVLIDVKQLELSLYQRLERHFLAKIPSNGSSVVSTIDEASDTLRSLCLEMDERYELLKDAQVRSVKIYNTQFINRQLLPTMGHRFLNYIILVIDELSDLIRGVQTENEIFITRLSQLGRAVGIHLVISTQRPSVGLVTGSIKANFTGRIAFRLPTSADSRTILENGGAEQLSGNGELIFSNGTEIVQTQGAYISTDEVKNVCAFIGAQRGYPHTALLPDPYPHSTPTKRLFDPSKRDPFFEEAARLIVMHQQGSTSLIQRKLKLGYNRAGFIIDQLEAAGIVGPFEGSKAREVLIPDDYSLEQYLARIDQRYT